MKRYWPLLFIAAMILFQGYVSTWNKNQTTTLANNETKLTASPSPFFQKSTSLGACASAFFYPEATKKDTQSGSVFIETSDEPFQVIEWYKQKFQTEDFSIISDVVNTTNGTSSNMLVGEKNNQQISIIIGRGAQETATTIFIHAQCN